MTNHAYSTTDLVFWPATKMVDALRRRELSARELLDAHLDQIDRVNESVNAIVTFDIDAAKEKALAADEAIAHGETLGPLHGLPIAHKDLVETKGMRTTYGSRIFQDHIPDFDALLVERLKNAGAVTIGKTNVPEFGAGSQTFNKVFGATPNPYALDRTCGGSSGGAAVALACGMIPIADGSDTGGSLRNPASFCNVVGFRPSPGRVPHYPSDVAWFPISVQGPMARTVADVALQLTAIAGPDARSPIAIEEPASIFEQPLERDFRGVKIAWSRCLGDLPIDPQVTEALDKKRGVFEQLGCDVVDKEPNMRNADEVFKAWRAWRFELKFDKLIEKHEPLIKETILWNAREGTKISGPELARIEQKRTRLYHRVREFMKEYEFLIAPVTQVPAFPIDQPYVTEINGTKMETYIDWMKSCYYITSIGHPAVSVPCGFTREGLPVGIQIIGRHNRDFETLQLAHAFEAATQTWQQRPGVVEP